MGNLDSVKTDVFIRFLKLLGLKEYGQKGSQVKWKKEGQLRSCVIRPSKKEIPLRHIKTNLGSNSASNNQPMFQNMAQNQPQ